jgi:hypothetical protein
MLAVRWQERPIKNAAGMRAIVGNVSPHCISVFITSSLVPDSNVTLFFSRRKFDFWQQADALYCCNTARNANYGFNNRLFTDSYNGDMVGPQFDQAFELPVYFGIGRLPTPFAAFHSICGFNRHELPGIGNQE